MHSRPNNTLHLVSRGRFDKPKPAFKKPKPEPAGHGAILKKLIALKEVVDIRMCSGDHLHDAIVLDQDPYTITVQIQDNLALHTWVHTVFKHAIESIVYVPSVLAVKQEAPANV